MPDPPITDPTDWKVNPDSVPLHPTGRPARHTRAAEEEDRNEAGVIRRVPAYPVSRTGSRVGAGAVGGLVGAVFLAAIAYLMFWTDPANPADTPDLRGGRAAPGSAPTAGSIMSRAPSASWRPARHGGLFGLLVRRPNFLKGAAFGLLPTLFLWLVMAPLMRKPLFMGCSTGRSCCPCCSTC